MTFIALLLAVVGGAFYWQSHQRTKKTRAGGEHDQRWEISKPTATGDGWRVRAPIARRLIDGGQYLVALLDKRVLGRRGPFGDGLHENIGTAVFEKKTGALVWHKYGTLQPTAVAGDLLFTYGRTGVLVALSLADGTQRWRVPLADDRGVLSREKPLSTFVPDVVVQGERVVVGAGKNLVAVGMDGTKGRSVQVCAGEGRVVDRVTRIASAKVILVTCTRRSFLDDADPAERVRERRPGVDWHDRPAPLNPRHRNVETTLAAVDATSLNVLWSATLVDNSWSHSTKPADGGDATFVMQSCGPKSSGHLVRADARSGKLQWQVATGGCPTHDAAVLDRATLSSGVLFRLADGGTILTIAIPGGSPPIADQQVAIGQGRVVFMGGGELMALAATGELKIVGRYGMKSSTEVGSGTKHGRVSNALLTAESIYLVGINDSSRGTFFERIGVANN